MRHQRLVPCLLLGASLEIAPAMAADGHGVAAPAAGAWLRVSNPPAPRPTKLLANTQWRLVDFQFSDAGQPAPRPDKPSRHVLRLDADGTATLWLNCNRVTGTWLAQPAGKASAGTAAGVFRFDHFPTRVLPCAAPGMEEAMLRQVPNVRSFTLRQGQLELGLMADSGQYVWSRDASAGANADAAPTAKPAPAPAAAQNQPANAAQSWQVKRRVNLREQPSTQSRVLALLPAGTRMQRGECQSAEGREWCMVTVASLGEGFVAAEYLQPVPANARR